MIRFLQSPGKVKKYLLGGLLVFISITMLLYLIPQGGSNITGQPNILARVGDDNITIEDVARRAEEFQRSQGRQIPPAMMPQLVDYMTSRGLKFAKASPGDASYYSGLYQQLVSYEIALSRKTEGQLASPAQASSK